MLDLDSDASRYDRLLTLRPSESEGDAWMISYMDIMTLLVALLVLMLSMGAPRGMMSEAIRGALTAVSGASAVASPAMGIADEALVASRHVVADIDAPKVIAPVPALHSQPSRIDETTLAAVRQVVSAPRITAQAVAASHAVVRHWLLEPSAIGAATSLARTIWISPEAQAAAIAVAGEWRVRQAEKPLPKIDGVEVSRIKGGITLRIQDHLLFDSGEAALTGGGEKVTQRLVDILQQYQGTISVEGHTDSVPIDTPRFPSNWELSSGRATAILRYLNKAGIDASRLRAVGYADTHPLKGNATAKGRAANRRVEVIIHEPDAS